MPSSHSNAIVPAETYSSQAIATATPRDLIIPESTGYGADERSDIAMNQLSRRLWSLEIHRRLEIRARRSL